MTYSNLSFCDFLTNSVDEEQKNGLIMGTAYFSFFRNFTSFKFLIQTSLIIDTFYEPSPQMITLNLVLENIRTLVSIIIPVW